jgi:dipeptidyl aminopeptidase/acylaminoacyl peptidase
MNRRSPLVRLALALFGFLLAITIGIWIVNQNNSAPEKMFGYIATDGENRGRLMVQKVGEAKSNTVSPAGFLVKDFRFLPNSQAVLFAAVPVTKDIAQISSPQIYQTNITNGSPKLVLDNKEYQNIKFEITPDGKIMVVHRVSSKNPGEFGIFAIDIETSKTLQRVSQGGSFAITPDSTAIAVSEGDGVTIKPFKDGSKFANFSNKFGRILSFASNGSAALLEKYNDNYTRDLFIVSDKGVEKKLLTVSGEIQAAQFTADGQGVYGIVAELASIPKPHNHDHDNHQDGDEEEEAADTVGYNSQPYLVAIEVATAKSTKLYKLHQQQGISMTLAPDGRSLIYDQVTTEKGTGTTQRLTAPDGQSITQSKLWMMPLPETINKVTTNNTPQDLKLAGYNPRWAT